MILHFILEFINILRAIISTLLFGKAITSWTNSCEWLLLLDYIRSGLLERLTNNVKVCKIRIYIIGYFTKGCFELREE
ncbi:hypothetical protein MYP_3275 [Sporocytophaga myxococcoides]|uniref:Uncharacterized protein n=1 Tax=Sporocytophaga myxococcoides TaxID=153721 RepID=A0A098LGD6_9BACT|nr:hypothetical protein [Sporocytophaga myxococcoides]GAL86046.1 hypothetical protein MYP_3275 [Sporocytophaga myxococcoides]